MKFAAVTRDISTFRQPLTPRQVTRLCQHAFDSKVSPAACQLIDSGKFNTSYRIDLDRGESVVLRVAPPAGAVLFQHERLLLQREASVQPVLNNLSDIFPRNLFVDFSHQLIDRDYVFQNCLEGVLWDEIDSDLSVQENRALWRQLGAIARSVHSVPNDYFGPPSPMHPYDCWSDTTIIWITQMAEDLRRYRLPHEDADQFLRIVEAGRRNLDTIARPRLVHGDLWQKNILVGKADGTPRITAVLDAERAFWGDPGSEWIFSFLNIPAPFWQAYGRLDADESAPFRRLVYQGRGAIQLCLEAWRFRFDDSHFRNLLRSVIDKLSSPDSWAIQPELPWDRRQMV